GVTVEDYILKGKDSGEVGGFRCAKYIDELTRKDGPVEAAGARIYAALLERGDHGHGKSNTNCEIEILDVVKSLNSEQVQQLEEYFQSRYKIGLRDAVAHPETLILLAKLPPNDKARFYGDYKSFQLTEKTKQSLDIYLKGSDQWKQDPKEILA